MQGMNFTEIDSTQVNAYVEDEAWWMQQKLDGTRALVHVNRRTETIDFFQRNGQPLGHTAATQHFEDLRKHLDVLLDDDASALQGVHGVWLDGEILIREGTLHVFDLPAIVVEETNILETKSYSLRHSWLQSVLKNLSHSGPVREVRTARGSLAKRMMLEAAREAGIEGVVIKHRDNLYQAGKRVKDVLKVKFVKTADVVVMGSSRSYNEAGREVGSFTFGIYDPDGPGDGFRAFGSCSAIGKPDAKVGDVIEVAYLYREPGGALVQPRMIRIREDKAPEDCREDQFPAYSREVI